MTQKEGTGYKQGYLGARVTDIRNQEPAPGTSCICQTVADTFILRSPWEAQENTLRKEVASRHRVELSSVTQHGAGFPCICRASAVRVTPAKSGSGDTHRIEHPPEGACHFRRLELFQLFCILNHHPSCSIVSSASFCMFPMHHGN